MVTPPKLPANDSLPPLMRTFVISSGLLAFGLVVALSLPTPQSGTAPSEAAKPEPVLTAENAVELCRSLFEEPKEYMDHEAKRRRGDLIELKLSANAQFQDRPGTCKLIETAVSRGDQSMAQRLVDCRAN